MAADRRRALSILADCLDGYTEAQMLARGLQPELLSELLRKGLAVERGDTIRRAGRSVEVRRLSITISGLEAVSTDIEMGCNGDRSQNHEPPSATICSPPLKLDRAPDLDTRDLEIISLVSDGCSNKQIARQLNLPVEKVKVCLKR